MLSLKRSIQANMFYHTPTYFIKSDITAAGIFFFFLSLSLKKKALHFSFFSIFSNFKFNKSGSSFFFFLFFLIESYKPLPYPRILEAVCLFGHLVAACLDLTAKGIKSSRKRFFSLFNFVKIVSNVVLLNQPVFFKRIFLDQGC